MFKSPFPSSYSFISNTAKLEMFICSFINVYMLFYMFLNVYMLYVGNIQSFPPQIFEVVGPLRENLEFFSPLGFDIQRNSDHETPVIKLYSVRALKRYLNEKNLHGRVTATISKFSLQIFETYFSRIVS